MGQMGQMNQLNQLNHSFPQGGSTPQNSFNLMNLLSSQSNEMAGAHPAGNTYNQPEIENVPDGLKEKIKQTEPQTSQPPQGQEHMMMGGLNNGLNNLTHDQLMQIQMYLAHNGKPKGKN